MASKLDQDIKEKEQELEKIKSDIRSRQKLLETLGKINSKIDDEVILEKVKQKTEEISLLTKQVSVLTERVEKDQATDVKQELKEREDKIKILESTNKKLLAKNQDDLIEVKRVRSIHEKQVADLNEKIAAQADQLAEEERTKQDLMKSLADLQARLESAKNSESNNNSSEADALRAKLEKKKLKKTELKQSIETTKGEHTVALSQIQTLQNDVAELKKHAAEVETKNKQATQEIDTLRVKLTESEKHAVEQKKIQEEELKKLAERLESKEQELLNQIKKGEEHVAQAKRESEEHEHAWLKEKEELKETNEQSHQKLALLTKEIQETLAEKNEMKSELHEAHDRIVSLQKSKEIAEKEMKELVSQLQLEKDRAVRSEEEKRYSDETVRRLEREKATASDRFAELQAERNKIDEERRHSYEEARNLSSLNFRLETDLKRCMEDLDEARANSEKFTKDAHAKYDRLAQESEERLTSEKTRSKVEIDRLKAMLDVQKKENDRKLHDANHTFDEEIAAVQKINQAKIAALEKEKLETDRNFQKVMGDFDNTLGELERLKDRSEQVITQQKKTIQEMKLKAESQEKKLNDSEALVEELKSSLSAFKDDLNKATSDNRKLFAKLKSNNEKIQNLDAELIKSEKAKIKAQSELDVLREQLKIQTKKATDFEKVIVPELKKQLNDKVLEIQLLKEMIASAKTMVRVKEQDIGRYKMKLQAQESEKNSMGNNGLGSLGSNFASESSIPNSSHIRSSYASSSTKYSKGGSNSSSSSAAGAHSNFQSPHRKILTHGSILNSVSQKSGLHFKGPGHYPRRLSQLHENIPISSNQHLDDYITSPAGEYDHQSDLHSDGRLQSRNSMHIASSPSKQDLTLNEIVEDQQENTSALIRVPSRGNRKYSAHDPKQNQQQNLAQLTHSQKAKKQEENLIENDKSSRMSELSERKSERKVDSRQQDNESVQELSEGQVVVDKQSNKKKKKIVNEEEETPEKKIDPQTPQQQVKQPGSNSKTGAAISVPSQHIEAAPLSSNHLEVKKGVDSVVAASDSNKIKKNSTPNNEPQQPKVGAQSNSNAKIVKDPRFTDLEDIPDEMMKNTLKRKEETPPRDEYDFEDGDDDFDLHAEVSHLKNNNNIQINKTSDEQNKTNGTLHPVITQKEQQPLQEKKSGKQQQKEDKTSKSEKESREPLQPQKQKPAENSNVSKQTKKIEGAEKEKKVKPEEQQKKNGIVVAKNKKDENQYEDDFEIIDD